MTKCHQCADIRDSAFAMRLVHECEALVNLIGALLSGLSALLELDSVFIGMG